MWSMDYDKPDQIQVICESDNEGFQVVKENSQYCL